MAGALVLVGAACPRAGKKPAKPVAVAKSVLPDSADQIGFGTRLVLTDKGVNKGELLADTSFTYDDGTRLEMRRVNLTFYNSLGLKDGVMTSRAGTYNMRLSRIEARGDVVVVREDGKRLTSQQLVFDQVRNQFFTDSAFVLNEPNKVFTGVGFESDPKLTNFRCLKECKGAAPVQVPTR
ncbi:MAG TPA: LPS export ABC transporter periplasmic protein LptC [Gemmatimonas sp.]|uniref:LPS export ABC transporter periplasmic protein LptC n=1 Tax=Gemmatimonas sp. TaxID=1962908 RepID=UPI002EDB368F